jgi:hypothetical protein
LIEQYAPLQNTTFSGAMLVNKRALRASAVGGFRAAGLTPTP